MKFGLTPGGSQNDNLFQKFLIPIASWSKATLIPGSIVVVSEQPGEDLRRLEVSRTNVEAKADDCRELVG